jgi:hypothetical protein
LAKDHLLLDAMYKHEDRHRHNTRVLFHPMLELKENKYESMMEVITLNIPWNWESNRVMAEKKKKYSRSMLSNLKTMIKDEIVFYSKTKRGSKC